MKRTRSDLAAISRLFALLEDPLRLRLLRLLRRRELCVCELVDALGGIPQYKVSRHLGALRKGQHVVARRQGRWMHYRLDTLAPAGRLAARLIEWLEREVEGIPEMKADHRRLQDRLCLRQAGQCVVGVRPARRVRGGPGDARARPTRGEMVRAGWSRK